MNMALFFNNNKSITFEGVKINLFYPGGTVTSGDKLFEENQFSVVQELPYIFKYQEKRSLVFVQILLFFLTVFILAIQS
jgi:type I restriction enzyme, R subunit